MKNTSLKTQKNNRDFVTILGIRINSTPKGELLKLIENKLAKKIQFVIVTPNPEIILQAQSDPKLTHSLNSADFSIPDGFGLRFAQPSLKITKGREFFLDLLRIANKNKLKIYLLGGRDFVNKKSQELLTSQYPNILVSGNSGPMLDNNADPVSEVDTNLQFEIVKEINVFKPDLLFVAFGAPKQEIWINKHLKDLKVTGALAIGGSLDYYSGFVPPVPNLFANLRLEWLWRLIQEPKRIKRIFNALIVFPILIVLSKRG